MKTMGTKLVWTLWCPNVLRLFQGQLTYWDQFFLDFHSGFQFYVFSKFVLSVWEDTKITKRSLEIPGMRSNYLDRCKHLGTHQKDVGMRMIDAREMIFDAWGECLLKFIIIIWPSLVIKPTDIFFHLLKPVDLKNVNHVLIPYFV